ncbi:MAG: hypothetical protein R3313_00610 [Candidatus Saccharimonadales bacterium]|nr:hypothetical protein [Candidatus Saccharimonadales bacterium]
MKSDKPLKAASNSYQTPKIARKLLKISKPLVISGVTAAGKNAVSQRLVERGGMQRVVTNTTRRPRQNEVDGVDYWFTEPERMFDLIKQRLLLETEVIHDSVYGCSIEALLHVEKAKNQPILTIDINGAMNLRRLAPSIQPIFLIPPSFSEWMHRLGSRAYLSDGERNRRMHSAKIEIETALNSKDFAIVVNNDLDETMGEILVGVPNDPSSQKNQRKAAQDILDYIKTR